ncbi:hypothetical protein NHX12_017436 [Muraenolepis orangiensis]|uniref:Interferon-induced transmembrane protein 3 n=1 Tax=Muraenolepis orangiensis TaxID=630683 RepID=A0A9Q0EXR0_9TELE|nr:hypothetical protein NHX12_017436 [Muraenolepis orangiensis]
MATAPGWQKTGLMAGNSRETHSVTITSDAQAVHPRDHIIWSIFNLINMNPCCLGLVALYYSVKARDMTIAGDLRTAEMYGGRALCFNIAALVVETHSVTITSDAQAVHPRDHIIWSIFNLINMNPCCLGLVALYYSVKARDMTIAGDLRTAEMYGGRALCFNIAALVVFCVIAVIIIITTSVVISKVVVG